MSRNARTGWAIIAAFAVMIQGWGPITRDQAALIASVVAAAVVVGAGMATRALRLSLVVTLALQVGALLACAAAVVALGLGPGGLVRLPELLAGGIRTIQLGSAPLGPDLGVALDLVVFSAVMALLTHLLTTSLERPAYAFLTLLCLFLVPALGLPEPVAFEQVVRFGAGVGVVLAASSPHLSDRRRGGRIAAWGLAAAVVALALVGSFVVGARIPVPALRPPGQDQLQMSNPALDLKRNLTQGASTPVISYTTDRPTGAYLRLATLTVFGPNGFSLEAARVSTGRLPAVPGLREPGTPRTTRVRIGSFASEWLPVPYAPTEVRAPGWGWAVDTLDVMAMARPDRKTATVNTEYEVRSVDVRPSVEQVRAASSAQAPNRDALTHVPQELPPRIRALAQSITRDAPTTGAKALALEAYLRSDRFRYSTAHAEGDSLGTLDDFLFGSKTGYCEQFAGSMVAMARTLGIPARLAVGFTPGTFEDGTWEVSLRDMHTWPEIWLDGWGWVAFEPTPAGGVPAATASPPAASPTPSVTTQATETPEPTVEPEGTVGEEASPTPAPTASPTPAAPGPGGIAAGVLGVLVAAAIAVAPGGLRAWRRRSRLAGGPDARATTLAAWEELHAEATDLGVAWPAGSPRYASAALADRFPGDAAEGVRHLGLATERALFDRPEAFTGPASWALTVLTAERAMRDRAARGARVRAALWPRSLFGWRRAR